MKLLTAAITRKLANGAKRLQCPELGSVSL
jgi:hypothetical protein